MDIIQEIMKREKEIEIPSRDCLGNDFPRGEKWVDSSQLQEAEIFVLPFQ